jgi:tellurite resistance protein
MKFVNEADSMELLDAVMSIKNVIPNKAFVRRSLYKIMRLCKDYKRMAKAVIKTAEALKTAHTKFSENEREFYEHLVKIYKAEFSVK